MALAVRLLLNANVDHDRARSPARRAGEFFRPHWDPSANSLHGARPFPRRATMPHAATRWELPSFVLKGWGASPDKRRSIMMRNIVTGLAAAAIATAASTFSASAIHGGFGGGGFRGGHFGGGGFGRPAFAGRGFGRPAFAGRGHFLGRRAFAFRGRGFDHRFGFNRFDRFHRFNRFAFNRFDRFRRFNRFGFNRFHRFNRFAFNRFDRFRRFNRFGFNRFNRFAFRHPFFGRR